MHADLMAALNSACVPYFPPLKHTASYLHCELGDPLLWTEEKGLPPFCHLCVLSCAY